MTLYNIFNVYDSGSRIVTKAIYILMYTKLNFALSYKRELKYTKNDLPIYMENKIIFSINTIKPKQFL